MFLLKGIFIIILFGLLFIIMVAARLLWSARDVLRLLFGGRNNTARHAADDDAETVIDRRSPTQSARKIIADDEGEYVEFEEV